MGIFSQNTNRRKSDKEKKNYKWKRQQKAVKKATRGPVTIDVPDVELFSQEMLKNKLKNPRNNINISNKKKKRILKRLKHQQIKERQKDGDEEEGDFDMEEMLSQTPAASEASTSGTATPSTSGVETTTTTTKKKKKRGRKNKKKGKEGQGEDVEMEEL